MLKKNCIEILRRGEAEPIGGRQKNATTGIMYTIGRYNSKLYFRIDKIDGGAMIDRRWIPLDAFVDVLYDWYHNERVESSKFLFAKGVNMGNTNKSAFYVAIFREERLLEVVHTQSNPEHPQSGYKSGPGKIPIEAYLERMLKKTPLKTIEIVPERDLVLHKAA